MVDIAVSPPVERVEPSRAPAGISFVDWSAVFAGGILAAALAFVLITFGTAIGLSLTSPWPHESGLSARWLATLGAFWTVAVQIGAAMAGGYAAGRMRPRLTDASQDEVEFRDGLHGGLVWAVAVVIGAFVVIATASSVVRTTTDLASRAAQTMPDPITYQVNALFRSQQPQPAQGQGAQAQQAQQPLPLEVRSELVGILARSIANGAVSDADRTYVAQVVSRRAGVPQDEADRRVRTAYTEASRAVKDAADKARRTTIMAGFVTAVSLIVSLAAAWWAAVKGGNHRDSGTPASFVVRGPRP